MEFYEKKTHEKLTQKQKLETIIYKQKTCKIYFKKKLKQSILRQKIYKNTILFVCVCCLLLGLEPTLKCGLYAQWTPLEKTDIFHPNQLSVGDRLLIRNGSLYLLLPLSTGTLSGLSLCRPYACCHSLCEFIFVLVLLCLEDTSSV